MNYQLTNETQDYEEPKLPHRPAHLRAAPPWPPNTPRNLLPSPGRKTTKGRSKNNSTWQDDDYFSPSSTKCNAAT